MKYIFECSKEDYSTLEEQINVALSKSIELYSRTKLSATWRVIDRLNKGKRPSQVHLNKRKKRYKFYGILLSILGVIFILLGLMDPVELKGLIYYGLFLILVGILYIRSQKKRKRVKKSVKKFIEGLKENNKKTRGLKLSFDSDGIYSCEQDLLMRFEDIDHVIITQDIFFFIYSKNLFPLLKRDLLENRSKDFEAFLQEVFQSKVCYTG